MRTTLEIDDAVLRVVKDVARERQLSIGKVLSDFARKGMEPANLIETKRGLIPTLPLKPGGGAVTSQMVKDLLESQD